MEHFLEAVVSSALSAAVIAFLARSLIGQWLSKDLEAHKVSLQKAADLELARYRSEADRTLAEHQIRYARLNERQADIISEIFARLETMQRSFREWTRFMRLGDPPDMAKLRSKAIDDFNGFADYYYPRSIWLDRATCDSLNALLDNFMEPYYDFVVDADERGFPRDIRAWEKALDLFTKKIPAARAPLEQRLRAMLGVDGMPGATRTV